MLGKCRIHGSSRWISLENRSIKDVLPQERLDNFFVEGLDLSKTVIKYNGLSNIGKYYLKANWHNIFQDLF
jgi:hypothetical protein